MAACWTVGVGVVMLGGERSKGQDAVRRPSPCVSALNGGVLRQRLEHDKVIAPTLHFSKNTLINVLSGLAVLTAPATGALQSPRLIPLFASCATLDRTKPDLRNTLRPCSGAKGLCAVRCRSAFFDDPTRDLVKRASRGRPLPCAQRSGRAAGLEAKLNNVHPGSIWRIDRISFPTRFERVMRPLRSPRHLAWLHLLSGSSRAVLVIPRALGRRRGGLSGWISALDMSRRKSLRLNPAARSAVTQGRLVSEMDAGAAKLALCPA